MKAPRVQHQQRQLLLALLLFLVGQFTFALHSHDLNLHTDVSDECVICLVTTADDPSPAFVIPDLHFLAKNSDPLPAFDRLAFLPQQTPSQPRAPPCS